MHKSKSNQDLSSVCLSLLDLHSTEDQNDFDSKTSNSHMDLLFRPHF